MHIVIALVHLFRVFSMTSRWRTRWNAFNRNGCNWPFLFILLAVLNENHKYLSIQSMLSIYIFVHGNKNGLWMWYFIARMCVCLFYLPLFLVWLIAESGMETCSGFFSNFDFLFSSSRSCLLRIQFWYFDNDDGQNGNVHPYKIYGEHSYSNSYVYNIFVQLKRLKSIDVHHVHTHAYTHTNVDTEKCTNSLPCLPF